MLKCEVINIYTKSYDLGIPDKAGYPSWFLIKILCPPTQF